MELLVLISSGQSSGSVVDLGLSNNRDAIGRPVGGAGHQYRGRSATVVPDEPLPFSTNPHQHHHHTYLCHQWGSWVVNHFGALSATDSFLRSRITGFTQGLETPRVRECPFFAGSLATKLFFVRSDAPSTVLLHPGRDSGFRSIRIYIPAG